MMSASRLLSTTYEIQASVLNHQGSPRDLVEQAERAMLEVAHDDRQKDFRTIDEILDDELKKSRAIWASAPAQVKPHHVPTVL